MALNDAPTPSVPAADRSTGSPAQTAKSDSPLWVVPLYVAGIILLFVGQRILVEFDTGRRIASGIGVGAMLAATLARLGPLARQSPERKRIEVLLSGLSAGGLLAVTLYFAGTEWGLDRIGLSSATRETRDNVQGMLQAAWVILGSASLLPMLFAEAALYPMRRGPQLEARRVATAAASGVTLALAASYGALFVYAASKTQVQADFSYFKTSDPGEATIKMLQSLDEPLQVNAFFPEVSEVRRELGGYFAKLAQHTDKLEFSFHDRYLEPKLTKDLQVSSDGTVVLQKGEAKRVVVLGADIKSVQPKLKTWDRDFQEVLYKVIRSHRTAYLTVGHGELNDEKRGIGRSEGRTANLFKQLLQKQNYVVRDLGLTGGLATEIPKDAALVAVLGPLDPFAPEELSALRNYMAAGGSLFLALDTDAHESNEASLARTDSEGAAVAPASSAIAQNAEPAPSAPAASPIAQSLDELAALASLKFNPTVLANEARHMQRSGNPSDNVILMTNLFSSHASVSTLSRNASRTAVVMLGASSLDKLPAITTQRVDFTLRSLSGTFADTNRDFKREAASEPESIFNLGAAVANAVPASDSAQNASPPADASEEGTDKAKPQDKEMRAFVLADADVVSDLLLGNFPANQMLTFDALRWLGGEESFTGEVNSEEDVRIEHSKQKDLVWFYATILGVPGLVLGGGLTLGRRARKTKGGSK